MKTGQIKASRNMIVWKKAVCKEIYGPEYWNPIEHMYCLVKLKIAKGTRINVRLGKDIDSRKCRSQKAEVLGFYTLKGTKKVNFQQVISRHDNNFIYKVGDELHVKYFDRTLRACGRGIHFFLKLEDAAAYQYQF